MSPKEQEGKNNNLEDIPDEKLLGFVDLID
jgi:hypothetical protein